MDGENAGRGPKSTERVIAALGARRGVALVAIVALYGATAFGIARLQVDSDLLCALPPADPEVRLLRDLEGRFGILSTALVGASSDALFTADALQALRNVSRAVQRVPGVVHAQSITEVLDIEATPDGSTIAPLIGDVPKSPAALAALRQKVLHREGVAGNLVASSGNAALVVAQLAPGVDAPAVAAAIRDAAQANAGPLHLHFTGGPVVADYVAKEAGKRVAIFVPGALLAVAVVLLALSGAGPRRARHLWVPLAVGVSTLGWTVGAIALAGLSLCGASALVLALPFVLGLTSGGVVARRGVLASTPALALGAIVTAGALGALAYFPETRFQAIVGGAGAGFAALAAVLIGAVAGIDLALRREGDAPAPMGPRWRPVALGGLLAIFALGGGAGLLRLEAPTSGSAAFGEAAGPRVAERFLAEHFRYGETVFAEVRGDLTKAAVVRGLESLEEALQAVPGVTTVQSIALPLRVTHQGLTGRRQLPEDDGALRQLWTMLDGNKDIATLVARDRQSAMLLVQLAPEGGHAAADRVREVVARFREGEIKVRTLAGPADADARAAVLATRLEKLAARYGGTAPKELASRAAAAVRGIGAASLLPAVRKSLAEYFASDEALVPMRAETEPPEAAAPRVDRIAAALAPLVLGEMPAARVRAALAAEAPAQLLREDPEAVDKSVPLVFERARSAALDALVQQLRGPLDPGARPKDHARASRYDAELRSLLFSVLDRAVYAFVPTTSPGALALRSAATGPSLAMLSADRAQRRGAGLGCLAALALALVLTIALRRSTKGASAALPGLVAALTVVGALGLAGIPTDPTLLALLTLAIGAGIFGGVVALPSADAGEPSPAALPLFAAAALFAALLASGFVPLQRFGAIAALALLAAAVGVAWLAALRARQRN